MLINVIHLRKENFDIGTKQYEAALLRENNIYTQLREQNITEYTIWNGVIDKPVHKAICRMHKMIVQDAKDKGLPMVTIMEDDAKFTCVRAWEYYQQQMPQGADIFLGMVYSGEVVENRLLNGWSGMTLITIFEKFYNEFLSVPDARHIDRTLGIKCFENNYQVCPEYVATQIGGYTFNLDRTIFYDSYLIDKKLFGIELNSSLKLE